FWLAFVSSFVAGPRPQSGCVRGGLRRAGVPLGGQRRGPAHRAPPATPPPTLPPFHAAPLPTEHTRLRRSRPVAGGARSPGFGRGQCGPAGREGRGCPRGVIAHAPRPARPRPDLAPSPARHALTPRAPPPAVLPQF